MQPSSIIFIVLIAVWAAYFALYWLRRREHLATAETADQLTSAMRVLERRSPVTRAEPSPRSYAASPTRALPGRLEADLDLRHDADHPVRRSTASARRSTASMRPSRRVRGLTMLTGLVAAVAAALAATLGVLPWLSVAAPVALAIAGFLWLRAGVQAQIRATRRNAGAARPHRAQAAVVSTGPSAARVDPVAVAAAATVAPVAPVEDEPVDQVAEVVPEPEPEPVRPLVDEDDIPLTWNPVPVPRPTYVLKAKAQRPSPEPAETTPVADPVTLDETAYAEPERRVAGA